MANKTAQMIVRGSRSGRFAIRVTFIDAVAGAATFTDRGGATEYVPSEELVLYDCIGDGVVAPAAVTTVQPNVDGVDRLKFIDLSAVYNRDSTREARLGAMLGARIPQGTTLRLISR